jgi:ribonuclease Y
MTMIAIVTILIIGGVAGVLAIFYIRKTALQARMQEVETTIQKTMEESSRQVKQILSKANAEAQEIISKSRHALEDEIKSRRQSITEIENRIAQKEKHLDSRDARVAEKEETLTNEIERYKQLSKKREQSIQDLLGSLERVANWTVDEARNLILSTIEQDVRQRAGKMIKDIEEQAKKMANRRAKEIVTDAIQRTAIDHVAAATTSVVQLPDDEMKGRIIGREGRNIRSFEAITGVDVIIDDTPNAVILSSFDPIRREIARLTLQKLVVDGRIHPARIEEAVAKSKKELQEIIREKGEYAAEQVNLQFHPKIIELLGKLHYRTSYGQNILAHSLEAAHVAGVMASELGVNVQLAKRGALLHDIGKALDFEKEGTHTELGKEVCEKYGESAEVINCIMAHHEDEDPETIEAVLVMIGDAISSARPGARRESIETYVKRLEKLEGLATSFPGVEKAYAIQAGREVRVMVKPDEIDDPAAHKLAFDMAKKIEEELDYPGEVKVSIIRETRAVGVAR